MSLQLTNNVSNVGDERSSFIDMVYNYDWSSTPLGPMDSWEPQIISLLNFCLKSEFPTTIFLSPEWTMIYNEASIPILKSKHPNALGKPALEIWHESSDSLKSALESVKSTRKGVLENNFYLELQRDGYIEEVYFNYTFSPIFKLDGTFWGAINITSEVTQKVLNVRRLKTLESLGRQTADAKSLESVCHTITKILKDDNKDIPYALIYLVESNNGSKTDHKSLIARLISTTFDEEGRLERKFPDYLPETQESIELTTNTDQNHDSTSINSPLKCNYWPIRLVMKEGKHVQVLLEDGSQAILLPTKLSFCKEQGLSAILIFGLNPHRRLDDQYMDFLQSAVNCANTALMYGRSIEEEKKYSNVLADLNHQKDAFFQNISHELKTPLTLIFSPLDELINACPQDAQMKSYLQIIRRNTCRLLKLINNFLQFSNVESGRLEAHFCETNISKFTQELVMNFESMAKTLGLEYIVDIPNPDKFNGIVNEKVYLDHDMYETIIFNLCSNALKNTWKGRVCVRLYLDHKDEQNIIVLEVSDTGVGIPETALPNIFQRFYRVESHQSRSYEGTGIGLALVKEFITRHGGDITVTSVVNKGTTFKCWFPTGCKHLSINQIYHNNIAEKVLTTFNQKYSNRQLYLEENSQWIQNYSFEFQNNLINKKLTNDCNMDIDNISTREIALPFSTDNSATTIGKKYQILLVDDNADMRNYLSDLLREFNVLCAYDGRVAIRILKELDEAPDLILSDIRMPNINGYELLDLIRSNKKTHLVPVILLSAKAGEESRINGLNKGADDYLSKPFSARELIARIRANIELSLLRGKLSFQQRRQEGIEQFLFSISNKIYSTLDLKDSLSKVLKEIHRILQYDRVFVISCEPFKNSNSRLVASYEAITSKIEQFHNEAIINSHSTNSNSQDSHSSNSEINISLNTYCAIICKNVSVLSAKITVNNDYWGWIKLHRSPNSIWRDSEKELLQRISNHLGLTITNKLLMEENLKKELQIKAEKIASDTKSQILANTSHELRTPLGAIVGILSSFEDTSVTDDQKDMIDIMAHASDVVLSIINDILSAAKLEAQKITLINRTFDLLNLFERVIEQCVEGAENKQIEIILNYDIDNLPIYVKSDPERLKQVLFHLLSNSIKFTEKGEVVMEISMEPHDVIDEDIESSTYGQIIKKYHLLINLCDTGIGIDPKFMNLIWESFSKVDTSLTRRQDGIGLGLSICKNLVAINGGEINAESQLGEGSKFWFTWNVDLVPSISLFSEQLSFALPTFILSKKILIIHPVESARNAMLKHFNMVNKVDAFDTPCKGIQEAKRYYELHHRPAYDIVFIRLYEKNQDEVMKAALMLREIDVHDNNLLIIFMVYPSDKGTDLARKLIEKIGGRTAMIYTTITYPKLVKQLSSIKDEFYFESKKRTADYRIYQVGDSDQDLYEIASKSRSKSVSKSKCILCVDENSIDLKATVNQLSTLGYSTISAESCQEAIGIIRSEFELLNISCSSLSKSDLNILKPCRISMILIGCNLRTMSGFDISQEIRLMFPQIANIPIIALATLAAFPLNLLRDKYMEAGMDDYLIKPLRNKQLEKVLTQWINDDQYY
ncbi:hypothetical protein C2G38_2238477 [Gigaspora rosea]|uniref:histidine kinase n=1 Tax=Gigaspora rosea TaxID=44941 RepID=A0A397WBI1_9GLOM|nr:hypothetical protein C2G38_2238477 [Gigaspora rosea]